MRIFFKIFMITSISFSQSGLEIARMVDNRETPKDLSNVAKMILTNSKGKSRINKMASRSMDGNKKQIIWFLEPKDDKGVAFLKIEHNNKDDEMRMWLPAFNKVRRISSKKKGDSFMGSDLSYEDMSNRNIDEYSYNRLDDALIDGKTCYVIEAIPASGSRSSYSKHISWIDQKSLMAIKEESYDRRGNLKKKKEFSFLELMGYFVMNRVYVEDVQKKHSTEVTFDRLEVDTGISSNLFLEKNLKRLPNF